MDQEKPLFKILWSHETWDSDRHGLAEYLGEKVFFAYLIESIDTNPKEIDSIISQHKIDINQLSKKEYSLKYPKHPWISTTIDYDIYYDNHYETIDYLVDEKIYHIYQPPPELIDKLINYPKECIGPITIERSKIININMYKYLMKIRPSELNIIKN